MSEKISPLDRAKAAIDLIKKKAELSQQYKSGEIEQLRKQKVAEGDYPWRILRYLRVVEPTEIGYPIPRLGYVRPKTFEKHLTYLSRECQVVPLPTLLDNLINDQPIAEKTVAITFDNGWVDQFAFAAPALNRFQLPATFFLPTGFIGTGNYFWQDKILFVLLTMKDRGMNFIPFDFFSAPAKEALNELSPDGSITLDYARAVILILGTLEPTEHSAALMVFGEIMEHLGGAMPSEPAFMSWEEVKLLKRLGMDLGSVGHRHRYISGSTRTEFEKDALESFEMLDIAGSGESRLYAIPEDFLVEESATITSETKVCDALFGIKFPGTTEQIVFSESTPVIYRTHISEADAPTVESLAALLWL